MEVRYRVAKELADLVEYDEVVAEAFACCPPARTLPPRPPPRSECPGNRETCQGPPVFERSYDAGVLCN